MASFSRMKNLSLYVEGTICCELQLLVLKSLLTEELVGLQSKNNNTTREELQKHISAFNAKSRIITGLVLHCSATKEGEDYSVKTIEKWHKERGFTQIGYHFVIHPNGDIDLGRDMVLSGAHVSGHNAHTLGICYIGGLDVSGKAKDTRTPEQKESIEWLLRSLVAQIPSVAEIKGHRDYPRARTASPSFDAIPAYKSLIKTNEQ